MKRKNPDGPFKDLGSLIKNAGMNLGQKPLPPSPPKPMPVDPPEPPELPDDELFSSQMDGVRKTHFKTPVQSERRQPPALKDTAAEERRLMECAMAGDPALQVTEHPEHIEGWIGVAGKQYIQDLRNGMYSIQAQIDLHGLSREEAKMAVEEFVEKMSRGRPCCVKIVHGRGINSPSDRAILKESLQRWLLTRRLGRSVVAFASAPLKDGGVGAIYLLLRSRH